MSQERTVGVMGGLGPEATLDFLVDDAVDMSQLKDNEKVNFTFEIRHGEFVIIKLNKAGDEKHQHEEAKP